MCKAGGRDLGSQMRDHDISGGEKPGVPSWRGVVLFAAGPALTIPMAFAMGIFETTGPDHFSLVVWLPGFLLGSLTALAVAIVVLRREARKKDRRRSSSNRRGGLWLAIGAGGLVLMQTGSDVLLFALGWMGGCLFTLGLLWPWYIHRLRGYQTVEGSCLGGSPIMATMRAVQSPPQNAHVR
jgi:hypothetical protein